MTTPADTPAPAAHPQTRARSTLGRLILALAWIPAAVVLLWSAAALWFDLPLAALRAPAAIALVLACFAGAAWLRFGWRAVALVLIAFGIVASWWLTLRPSNARDWQPDVATLPWAEFHGDSVTVHNVRLCTYRTETDYDVALDDRTYDLNRLTTLDMYLVHWGSPLIAHTMVSFGFDDGRYLCFSIEARKEKGESYSAIRGFFRRFERTYIVADERDLVFLRTNIRKGEDVRLYRLRPRPDVPRKLLINYLEEATRLRDTPQWYNALTGNCTTDILPLWTKARGERVPLDWRVIVNGRMDEWFYERGAIEPAGTFAQTRAAALINPVAATLRPDAEFSRAIRIGRPGCEPAPGGPAQ